MIDAFSPHVRQTLAGIFLGLLLQGGFIALAALVIRYHLQKGRGNPGLDYVRRLPWHDMDAIVLMVALIGTQLLAIGLGATVARLAGIDAAQAPAVSVLAQTIIFPTAALVLLAVLARRRSLRASAWFGVRSWRQAAAATGNGALFYFAMMPFIAIATYLYNQWLNAIGYPVSPQPVIDLLLSPAYPSWLRVQIVVLAVAVAPLVEECVFRGVLLPLALRRARPALAVASVSFIFAALHMHIPSLVPLFLLACAFSAAYLQTGSLLVPIVMHALFNAVSIAVTLTIGDSPNLF